jgi:hypothetical protein
MTFPLIPVRDFRSQQQRLGALQRVPSREEITELETGDAHIIQGVPISGAVLGRACRRRRSDSSKRRARSRIVPRWSWLGIFIVDHVDVEPL